MKAEIIENLPFDEYLKLNRLSSSALKDFYRSPKYFKFRKENPMKETDAMRLGTMIHTWLLENHTFQHLYYAMPELPELGRKPVKPDHLDGRKDKDNPEYIEYKEELSNWEKEKAKIESVKNLYIEQAGDRIVYPKEVIDKFTHFTPYSTTKNEVTVLFEYMGIKCKARFDVLHDRGVEDIKTTADIFRVEKQFYNLSYYLQAGFYQLAFKEAFGFYPDFFNFTFISTNEFVVKETFEMTFAYMEIGREMAVQQMAEYKRCVETDSWPLGLNTSLDAPSWL